jgi:hypothetical protein
MAAAAGIDQLVRSSNGDDIRVGGRRAASPRGISKVIGSPSLYISCLTQSLNTWTVHHIRYKNLAATIVRRIMERPRE